MNKFIEEKIKEFEKLTDENNIPDCGELSDCSKWLKNNQDKHLFAFEVCGEPMYDVDAKRVADWIKQTIQDCQNRERERVVEMIEKEAVAPPYSYKVAMGEYYDTVKGEIINKIKELK